MYTYTYTYLYIINSKCIFYGQNGFGRSAPTKTYSVRPVAFKATPYKMSHRQ